MEYQVQDIYGKWHTVNAVQAAAYAAQGVPVRAVKDGEVLMEKEAGK
jgi:hypothetical protein